MRHLLIKTLVLASILTAGCIRLSPTASLPEQVGGPPLSCPKQMLAIPAGFYLSGSTKAERSWAYENGGTAAQKGLWYDRWDRPPTRRKTEPYCIDKTEVTQSAYANFVSATGHRVPTITEAEYRAQGFLVHSYAEVKPYLWQNEQPPPGKLDHPVVLVSQSDALSYCAWRGTSATSKPASCSLPSEDMWERAARGDNGHWFPWGNRWSKLNVNYAERFHGTTPVTRFVAAASPFGMVDSVGNVFEWVNTAFKKTKRVVVKGCSWDDNAGLCRASARHGRPPQSRHILFGFRCSCRPN